MIYTIQSCLWSGVHMLSLKRSWPKDLYLHFLVQTNLNFTSIINLANLFCKICIIFHQLNRSIYWSINCRKISWFIFYDSALVKTYRNIYIYNVSYAKLCLSSHTSPGSFVCLKFTLLYLLICLMLFLFVIRFYFYCYFKFSLLFS